MTQARPMVYIASIKPGSSAEKSLKVKIPEDRLEGTVESFIRYALETNVPRAGQRIRNLAN